jgi:hypothetical protein
MPKTVSISGIYARKTLKNGGKRTHKREGIRLKEREEGIEIGNRKNLREKFRKRANMKMILRMNRGKIHNLTERWVGKRRGKPRKMASKVRKGRKLRNIKLKKCPRKRISSSLSKGRSQKIVLRIKD